MNVQPKDQAVEVCLSKRRYYIDFYQREYVWSKEIVKTLLDDIFYSFDLAYVDNKNKDISADLIDKFNWYYLNIYITNNVGGKEYVVDGQQRLTSLSLMAVKLLHLAKDSEDSFENIIAPLEGCIYGTDVFVGKTFWLDNDKRKRVMQQLVDKGKSDIDDYLSVTEENIVNRYKDISKYLDDRKMSITELRFFILYFLKKLVLVELKVEKDDTPMVFEVINDRGVALKPFEILKGKLIGALDKDDTEFYCKIWEESFERLRGIEDVFFSDYLKGKYIFKKNTKVESYINNQYHRYIFENNSIGDSLKFRKQDEGYLNNIKSFISGDLKFYSKLYSKLKKNEEQFLSYNNDINDLKGQYQNIIAACFINDPNIKLKVSTISREIDRIYVLLRLNGLYDSNNFQEISYSLNEKLVDIDISDYREVFNNILIDRIKEKRNLSEVSNVLDYKIFSLRGYDNVERRALRYFFARIEKYLCDNLDLEMEKAVDYISTKTGHKTGYHIEHILSKNEENIKYFKTEEEFEKERNRLGGLLLLFNKDNIISGNEKYFEGKRSTYENGLVWGRTLVDSIYHSTNARFRAFRNEFEEKTGIEFKHIVKFNKEALEYRSKLLYALVKLVWEV